LGVGKNTLDHTVTVSLTALLLCVITAAHTIVWKTVVFSSCDLFIYSVHQPYLGCSSTDLAENWHTDRKLV